MTTIEDKISLFSKIIYDKLNEEKEEKLEAFNEKAIKQINMKKQSIEDLRKNLIIEVTKKSNIKANEIMAREKLNKQREILALKDKLIKAALEEIKDKLEHYVSTESYREYFLNILENVFKEVEGGNYYIIVLKRDYDRFKKEMESMINSERDKRVEIKLSQEDFIGGIILKDFEGKFKIDHSLYSKLVDSKELIGVKVMEMLT